MNAHAALERVGLNPKERTIYISLLELNLAKASSIAQKAKIERRTTYEILNRLKSKGFVSIINKKGIAHFKAEHPKKILEFMKETERLYQNALPSLTELMQHPDEELKIDILSGKEGLRTLFEDILDSKMELLNFGGFSRFDKTDIVLWKQFLRDRQLQKMREKVIYFEGEKELTIQKGVYKKIQQEPFPTSVAIYGDKIAITIFSKDTYSIIRIDNKDFADSYKKYFWHYWRIAR